MEPDKEVPYAPCQGMPPPPVPKGSAQEKGGVSILTIHPSLGTSCLTLGRTAFLSLSLQGSPLDMTKKEVDTHPPSFTLIEHEIFVTK